MDLALNSILNLLFLCLGGWIVWWVSPFLPPPQRVFQRSTRRRVTPPSPYTYSSRPKPQTDEIESFYKMMDEANEAEELEKYRSLFSVSSPTEDEAWMNH